MMVWPPATNSQQTFRTQLTFFTVAFSPNLYSIQNYRSFKNQSDSESVAAFPHLIEALASIWSFV